MKTINLKDVQQKLYEKLIPSGWGPKLKLFLLSNDFYQILETLLSEAEDDKRFTPVLKQVFRAFEECPYKDLKVVIIGQDPYPQAGVADGIAFSCSNKMKVQPSLRYIFKEVERTVYPEGMKWDPDLKRWSNQGVLLLNTAMTCRINKIGSHVELWTPFINFVLDMLNNNNNGLIYVFMGKVSSKWAKEVDNINYKFIVTHPASAAYRGGNIWDTNDVFNRINNLILKNNNESITW